MIVAAELPRNFDFGLRTPKIANLFSGDAKYLLTRFSLAFVEGREERDGPGGDGWVVGDLLSDVVADRSVWIIVTTAKYLAQYRVVSMCTSSASVYRVVGQVLTAS